MDGSDNNNVRWHAVSTLRDDEVDFDENWPPWIRGMKYAMKIF